MGDRGRVLVTGGAGYIGSHTAKALAEAGFEPVVFDHLEGGFKHNVQWGPLFEDDLANTAAIRRAIEEAQIEAVIHFAAYAYVGESMRKPRAYFRNNIVNTLNLLDAMLDLGVDKIVFSSSCTTYGVPTTLPIAEDHQQNPINPYGQSKLLVEAGVEELRSSLRLEIGRAKVLQCSRRRPYGSVGRGARSGNARHPTGDQNGPG